MGYIGEDGKWYPFGSSPVKDAYWAFVNPEGKAITKEGFVLPDGITQREYEDKLVRDMLISSAVPPKAIDPL